MGLVTLIVTKTALILCRYSWWTRLFWIYPKVMITNFEFIWLNIFVRLHILASERLLDIFNKYDGPIYVNLKYVHAINFN